MDWSISVSTGSVISGVPCGYSSSVRTGDRRSSRRCEAWIHSRETFRHRSSSFIGRQARSRQGRRALETSRVVTITGVGGVGKTRMAIQVAADVLPRYRDGAWLVELAPVRDPDGVVEAVAAVFRLTARSGQSLEDTLLEMLAKKQMLLVLDNCEHVLGAVARLVSRIERNAPASWYSPPAARDWRSTANRCRPATPAGRLAG